MDNKEIFKQSNKDKIFEELIIDLKPITIKSQEKNFGTSSTAKGSTNHTLEFRYKGYDCKVELK